MTLAELNEYGIIKAHIEHCRDKVRELSSRTIRSPIFDTSGISSSPSSSNPTEEKYINTMMAKSRCENSRDLPVMYNGKYGQKCAKAAIDGRFFRRYDDLYNR